MDKKIMTIFAHQDDETFSAGGVLAKYGERGVAVSVTSDPLREKEFESACRRLGIQHALLQNKTVEPLNSRKIMNQLIDIILQYRPSIVITHIPFDYHHEHRLVSSLVKEAVEWVSHTTRGDAHQLESLWGAETTVLIPFPEVYIDISDSNEKRLAAIQSYESQSHKGGEGFYSRFHSARTRLRGIQAGVEHAEAYIQFPIAKSGAFKPQKVFDDFP